MAFLAKYVLGGDVSYWQGIMNWAKFAAAGGRFTFIRAGSIDSVSGVVYMDDQFPRNREESKKYVEFRGAFFYARPNFSAELQGNFFGDLYNTGDFNLPPVVDIETDGGQSPEAIAVFVETMSVTLYKKTGVMPELLYTRAEWWNRSVADRAGWETRPLYIARYKSGIEYPYGNPGDQDYLTPRDWPIKETDWEFWQFSADNNGLGDMFGAESASIDLDYFNGNYDQLRAFSEAYFPPVVDPPVDPTPVKTQIVTKFFEVRSTGAGKENEIIAAVPNDEIWKTQFFIMNPAGGRDISFGYGITADNSGKSRFVDLYSRSAPYIGHIRFWHEITFQPGASIEYRVNDVTEGQKIFIVLQVEILKIT